MAMCSPSVPSTSFIQVILQCTGGKLLSDLLALWAAQFQHEWRKGGRYLPPLLKWSCGAVFCPRRQHSSRIENRPYPGSTHVVI
jgi:hypothetical protein